MTRPLPIFRRLARSGLEPKTPVPVTDAGIAEERHKIEGHQLSLAAAIAPLAIIALDFGLWGKGENLIEKVLSTLTLALAGAASILLLGLIQVSRDRVRSVLKARRRNEKQALSHAISLKAMHRAHSLAVLSYAALALLVLVKIWGA